MTEQLKKPGSSAHGILLARSLEWVAMLSFRRSSQSRDEPPSLMFPALAGMFFTTGATWEDLLCACVLCCI